MRDLLTDMGLSIDRPGWEKDLRIHEAICGVGEPVVVTGRARWEIDAEAGASGYRDVSRRLRMSPTSFGRLVVTDDPKVLQRSRIG